MAALHEIPIEAILLFGSALVLASILASKISGRLGIPALLIFLAVGMLAGSEGLGGIYFDDPWIAKSLGVVALAIILFAGGLDTDWASVRPVLGSGVALSTVGVVVTAVLVGLFAAGFLKLPPLEGFLLGAIVSSTDAAAVFTVLRSRKISLKPPLQPLLELESGSNDPMAVFLTLGFIQLIAVPGTSAAALVPWFVGQAAIGALFGISVGKLIPFLLGRLRLEYDGLYPVLVLAVVLLTYGLATVLGGNGFLATYLAGLVMSPRDFLHKRTVARFHDGMAWLMQIAMFVVLGLLVFPSRLPSVLWPGILVCLCLMFVARPAGVMLSLLFSKMPAPEKRMVSWVGLRGAAPIILATFALLARVPHAETIFNTVFFVVLTSVLLQGTSVPLVARWLKVDAPLEKKRRYPIEFEHTEGMDAELVEYLVPYNAAAAGKAIHQLNLPPDCLITLVCRDEKFIVASGKTVLEEGDVVLALVNDSNAKEFGAILSRLKKPA